MLLNICCCRNSDLTQPNQLQEQISEALIEKVMSYVFLKKETEYEETTQLSYCCHIPSDILEGTLSGNRGTKQHLPPDNARTQHQQTSGLPFYMHQIETENYGWSPSGLLVEVQDNEKEAIRCCYNSHCNIGGQSLHPGTPVCTSTIGWSRVLQKITTIAMEDGLHVLVLKPLKKKGCFISRSKSKILAD